MNQFSSFNSANFNFAALSKTSELTPDVKKHLSNVYNSLTATVISAAVGAYLHQSFHFGGPLSFLALIACLFAFQATPNTPEKYAQRFALLMGFGFIKGASIGPLISYAAFIDPSIVTSAFLGTVCIFGAFSAAALLAKRRSMLYIGGFLGSGLSMLMLMSFVNLFFYSAASMWAQIYLGLVVFSGFVIFDTQMIIEKAFAGDRDHLAHSLSLFIDFVAIFVRLLIILSSQNKRQRSSNSSDRRSRR